MRSSKLKFLLALTLVIQLVVPSNASASNLGDLLRNLVKNVQSKAEDRRDNDKDDDKRNSQNDRSHNQDNSRNESRWDDNDRDGRKGISFKSNRQVRFKPKFFDKFKHKDNGRIRFFCSSLRKKPPRGKPNRGPFDFETVEVTFKEVSVFSKQSGWNVVSSTQKTVDLLALTDDASELLSDAELPAGEYKMIRLKLKGDATGLLNGKMVPIDIPLNHQVGLILFGEFEVQAGYHTGITLKFDPDKSIHARGKNKFWMSPFIKIEGTLESDDDVIAPLIAVVAPRSGPTNLAAQTIRVEYSDENLVLSSLSIRLNGVESKSRFQIGPDAAEATIQLPQGLTRIEARISDQTFTSESIPVEVVVDSVAPVLSAISPTQGQVIYSTASSLNVSGESNEQLQSVSVNGQAVQVAANGLSFSGTISIPTSGANTITLQAKDIAGNLVQVQRSIIFNIDSAAPVIAFQADPAGIAYQAPYPIQVQVSDASPTTTRILHNGQIVLETSEKNFSFNGSLAEGSNSFSISSTDAAGNSALPQFLPAVLYVRDTVAPQIAIQNPNSRTNLANYPLSASVTDSGSGIDPASLRVRLDGADITSQASLNGSIVSGNIYLGADGSHTVAIQISDKAGNTNNVQISVTLDTVVPVLTNLVPDGTKPIYLASEAMPVQGQSNEALQSASVASQPATVSNGGLSFSGTVHIAQSGQFTISFEGTDLAGNKGRVDKVVSIVVDKVAPVISVDVQPVSITNVSVFPIHVQIADVSPAHTQVYQGGQLVYETDLKDFTLAANLIEGVNSFMITSVDAAGNISDPYHLPAIVLDSFGPILTITSPMPNQEFSTFDIQVAGQSNEPLSGLSVNGQAVSLASDMMSFSQTISLQNAGNVVLTFEAMDVVGNESSTSTPISVLNLPPLAKLTLGSPATGEAPLMVIFNASESSSPTGSALTYLVDFGDGSDPGTSAQEVHQFTQPGSYTVTLTVKDEYDLSSTAVVNVTAVAPPPPPNPVTQAPPPAPSTTAESLSSSVEYLYSGPNPIQTGVVPAMLDKGRVAVIRGTIFDSAGAPIPGVYVSVPASPFLGQTRTDANGVFRIVVNGGGDVVVRLAKNGYLPIQRKVATGFQDYFAIPQIQMVQTDSVMTEVVLNSSEGQVVQGSVQTDSLGSRKTTAFIPSETTAQLTGPGAPVSVDKLSLRATELTTGSNPELRFKAPLPPGASALYMVDISADEAIAVGADHVVFSKPVPIYVENVHGIPTGMLLEHANYDDTTSTWVPQTNGRAIKILNISNGIASLDIVGTGATATASQLSDVGITEEELRKLASTYQPGQRLLRMDTDRFSTSVLAVRTKGEVGTITTGDGGSGGGFPGAGGGSSGGGCSCILIFCSGCGGSSLPPPPPPGTPSIPKAVAIDQSPARDYSPSSKICGSIIDPREQSLGESVPIVGTSLKLNYSTARQLGRAANRTLHIPITYDELNGTLTGIAVNITVAGKTTRATYGNLTCLNPGVECHRDNAPLLARNQQLIYTWDGLDEFGQVIKSAKKAIVNLQYQYGIKYLGYMTPNGQQTVDQPTFGLLNPGFTSATVTTNGSTIINRYDHLVIGTQSAQDEVSGWLVSNHHFYDPNTQTLYFGDGSKRRASQSQINLITSIAGLGVPGNSLLTPKPNPILYYSKPTKPQPTEAIYLAINQPTSLLVGSNGTIYFSEAGSARIMAITPDGTLSVFAGTGTAGYSGDNGPASAAQFNPAGGSMGLTEGPDGSIYVADRGNHRIRRITKGVIRTVAGTGAASCASLDNTGYFVGKGPFPVHTPENITFIGDSIYFTDSACHTVIGGTITEFMNFVASATIIAGSPGLSGNTTGVGPALNARLNAPVGITSTAAGELYIADTLNHVVRRIDNSGQISTFVGNHSAGSQGDGGVAWEASLNKPTQLAWAPNGNLFITDSGNFKIRKVSPQLTITTFAGNGSPPSPTNPLGDGGVASQASFNEIAGLTVHPDGSLLVSDKGYNVIRKIAPFFGGATDQNYAFGSEDGSEIYLFGLNGLHQKTLHALTGGTKWEFGYDTTNRLTSIKDGDNNTTTILRDSAGVPLSITSPFGQVTNLTQDGDGNLAAITNPNNETYSMSYNADGLMTQFTRPSGKASTFQYDSLGNLIKDTDAATGFTALAAILSNYRTNVQISTAEGRSSSVVHTLDAYGNDVVQHTRPGGFKFTTTNTGLSSLFQTPENFSNAMSSTADPLLGLPASVPSSQVIKHGTIQAIVSYTQHITPSSSSNPFEFTKVGTVTTNGKSVTVNYSGASRSFSSTSQGGRTSLGTIDNQGRIASQQLGNLEPVSYAYDFRGQLASIQQGSRSSGFTYDARGNLASTTNPLNQTTSYSHDLSGRITKTTFHDGRSIDFAYDSDGNLTSVTPPNRPAHTFSFSAIDLLSGYFAPQLPGQGNATQYAYNRDKQITLITKPDGSSISFGYNTAARLSSISTNQGNTTFGYSSTTGQLISSTSHQGVSKTLAYNGDLINSVTVQFTPPSGAPISFSETYSYDSNFNLAQKSRTAISGAPASTTYAYDANQALQQVGPMTIFRNASTGLVSGSTVGVITDAYTYNEFGEIKTYQVGNLFSYALERDAVGRITKKTETIEGETTVYEYTYNDAGWLTMVKENGAVARTYGYDANGNRISQVSNFDYIFGNPTPSVRTVTLTYNNQDQILTNGAITYTHNANGEMISRRDTANNVTSIAYTPFGRARSLNYVPASGTGFFFNQLYDADQQLTAVTRASGVGAPGQYALDRVYTSTFGRVSARLPVNGTQGPISLPGTYEYGAKTNVPDLMFFEGFTHRIISDHQGSVRLVINVADGSVRQRMKHDEFGRILFSQPADFQPFGFAGGIVYGNVSSPPFLASQQQHLIGFGARLYDPEIGRWLSKDPIGFNGGSTNLYGYTMNDPINFIDPSGLFGVQLGVGGSAAAFLFGGAAEGGLAFTYSGQHGFQWGTYESIQGRAGIGGGAGVGGVLTITPAATQISDLQGPSMSLGAEALIVSGSVNVSEINGRPATSFSIGAGPGIELFPYVGLAYTGVQRRTIESGASACPAH